MNPSFDPVLGLVLVAAVSLLPVFAVLVTSFTKIAVVFALLKQALGLQQVPPPFVLNAVALCLTAFIMAPVANDGWDKVKDRAANPEFGKKFSDFVAVSDAFSGPLKEFLDKHAPQKERLFFMKSAQSLWPKAMYDKLTDKDLMILVPSFVVSELTLAFQIGFLLFLAFLVVDLITANILLAMGMQMTSPMTLAVPFKLLLFIALDGWSRLVHSLVTSYVN
jgi:type III secretion protein R